jgi:hypothetical protein
MLYSAYVTARPTIRIGAGAAQACYCRSVLERWQSGRSHRTRNSVADIPVGDDPFRSVLFLLVNLTRPSILSCLIPGAATELGSKRVARCSGFVLPSAVDRSRTRGLLSRLLLSPARRRASCGMRRAGSQVASRLPELMVTRSSAPQRTSESEPRTESRASGDRRPTRQPPGHALLPAGECGGKWLEICAVV